MTKADHKDTRSLMLVALVAGYVLSQFYRISNAVIAPELMRELTISPEAMGAITGLFFLTFAAAQIPVGILLDRFGPRRVMSGMLLIAVIGAIMFATAETAATLSLGRGLIGFGCAASFMGAFVVIGRWYPAERFATLTALVFTIAGLGQLLATTPLSITAEMLGWRGAFVAVAGLTALSALLIYAVVRDAPPGHIAHRAAEESFGDIGRGLVDVLRNRQLWHVSAIQFVCYSSLLAIAGLWGGPYLKDVHGLEGSARGNVLLALNVATLLGVNLYGRLERILDSRKWTMVGGGVVTAGIFALLAALPAPPLWLVTLLFVALGMAGSYFMLAHAHARQVVPDKLLGRGMTLQNMAVMGGVFATQAVSGLIVGMFTDPGAIAPPEAYRSVFAALALFTLAGLALYLPARNVRPSQLAAKD